MKEDRYEFDLDEWDYRSGERGEADIILTRKKPRVKVEWLTWEYVEESSTLSEKHYGKYHIVQFQVTGWEQIKNNAQVWDVCVPVDTKGLKDVYLSQNVLETGVRHYSDDIPDLYIGLDARDKWSTPVLLPEPVYSKLDEICRALEKKANG